MLLPDVRRAYRTLRKSPGFCLVVVASLALGIGSATAMFSLVDAVLLKPLPFPSPNRLVALWTTFPGEAGRFRVSAWEYTRWRERRELFELLALTGSTSATLIEGETPVELQGTRVSEEFFPLVGVQPRLGRVLVAEDFEASSTPVVVLSEPLWRGRFGADPSILRRPVLLDDVAHVVVGVLPDQLLPGAARASGSLAFVLRAQHFWVPLEGVLPTGRSHVFGVVGRLRPELSVIQAEARLQEFSREFQSSPDGHRGEETALVTLQSEAVGPVRSSLWTLLAAVACLLAIACVNVTHLQLLRARSRAREIAVRAALGAGSLALARLFVVEALLLAAAGGGVGLFVAFVAIRGVLAWSPIDVPRLGEAALETRTLLAAFAVCVGVGLLVSVAPVLHGAKRDLAERLRSAGSVADAVPAMVRWRRALAAGEVGLAFLLVAGGALLVKSFVKLNGLDPGFAPGRTLVFTLVHPQARYAEREELVSFYERLFEKLRGLPGVRGVAASYDPPFESNWYQGLALPDAPAEREAEPGALFRTVTPGYFSALGVELLEGRAFSEADDFGAPGAAVVNQAFARRFFPDGRVVGRRLETSTTQWRWGEAAPHRFQVVGVVENEAFEEPGKPPQPAFYLPYRQTPHERMAVLVRASVDPTPLVPEIRRSLGSIDPRLPMSEVRTLEEMQARSLARPRFQALVLSAFAACALLLALVGVAGVLGDAVLRRRREIGVRLALGADRARVFLLMLSEGLWPALQGVSFGLGAALALGRLLAGLLYDVSPADPLVLSAVAVALMAVGALACAAPAWRAARTDPMAALRDD